MNSMDQKEQALQFNRQLDRLLAGRAPVATLSSFDQQALKLARRLSSANFSSDSTIRDTLHLQLIKQAAVEAKPFEAGLLQFNFPTWAMVALVLMIFVIHSIGLPDPLPAIVADNQHGLVYVAELTTDSPTPSGMAAAQTFRPVPIPTPLAIPATTILKSQASLAANPKTQPGLISSEETQTPKPALQPSSGAKP